MASRLDLTMSFEARDADDGEAFFDANINWHNLPYDKFVAMEMLMMDQAKSVSDKFAAMLQEQVDIKKASGEI